MLFRINYRNILRQSESLHNTKETNFYYSYIAIGIVYANNLKHLFITLFSFQVCLTIWYIKMNLIESFINVIFCALALFLIFCFMFLYKGKQIYVLFRNYEMLFNSSWNNSETCTRPFLELILFEKYSTLLN